MPQKQTFQSTPLSPAILRRSDQPAGAAARAGSILRRRAFALRILSAGFALSSFSAHAFLEDVCFESNGTAFSCEPAINTAACKPGSYTNVNICSADLAAEYNSTSGNISGQTRSMVHMDATYYLAEFAGFSATQAYWIAAYDQAVDNGNYIPRGQSGTYLVNPSTCSSTPTATDCNLTSQLIDGLERNSGVGGTYFHYEAPFNGTTAAPIAGINGLTPNTDSPYEEPTLYNIEQWAEGTPLLCVDGLTNLSAGEYSTGASCYVNPDGSVATVTAEVAMIDNPSESQTKTQDYNTNLGLQQISVTNSITSANFNAYIGTYQQLAKFGIYIHSYQDRISHHLCLDDAYTNGPQVPYTSSAGVSEGDFNGTMTNSQCTQTDHILRHSWETGVSQSLLQSGDQTMGAALNGTLTQLRALASFAGVTTNPNSAGATITSNTFMENLYAAVQISSAQGRINAIVSAASAAGLPLMPGFTSSSN